MADLFNYDPNTLTNQLLGDQTGIGQFLRNSGNVGALATRRPQNPNPSDTWEPGGPSGQYPGAPNMPPHKPGFFGRGGAGAGILGIIGDALAAAGGGQPYFTQGVQRQRELQMRDQNELQRWIAEQQWKAAHPDVPTEQQNWDAYINAPSDRKAEIEKYRTMSAPRFVVDPSGQGGWVTPGSAAPTTSGPPAGAIDMLRKNPALAPQFREKYGVDPSPYLGGSAVAPQTGFPGSR